MQFAWNKHSDNKLEGIQSERECQSKIIRKRHAFGSIANPIVLSTTVHACLNSNMQMLIIQKVIMKVSIRQLWTNKKHSMEGTKIIISWIVWLEFAKLSLN